MPAPGLEVVELAEDTWPDLVSLFGPNGAVAGCWCTWFLQSAKQMQDNGTDVNREMLHDRVRAGVPVGLLARAGTEPVGWVAVAPRPVYPRLARSPLTRPVDPTEDLADVWSVTCLFVHRTARRRGVTGVLLSSAVEFAAGRGARAIEGYPVDTEGAAKSSGELYHGTLSGFLAAGFDLVERRGTHRAVVRRTWGTHS